MTFYNTDFMDLFDQIDAATNIAMSGYWSSFTNGYVIGENDKYYKGYRINGKSFPLVVKLTFHFPWSFYEWSGKRTTSEEYSNELGGGKLEFDGVFNFELRVAPELFERMKFPNSDIVAEPDEFKDIPVEKFTLDLRGKKTFKGFTQKDKKAIEKFVQQAAANMRENVQEAIGEQIGRRFEEFHSVDADWALEFAPQAVKDIFIF